MTPLPDDTVAHLREVLERPELPGGRYEVQELVGRGGMGIVYRAEDRALRRQVALKVLRPEFADQGSSIRLRREADILARLEHPGIVPIHDLGTLADGRLFYVMKLVRGIRLDEFARTVGLTERLRVFLRVLETVGFAHAHGLVHRDLKPANIMVGAFGEVLVLDWGIARIMASGGEPAGSGVAAGESDVDTLDGTVLGTPGFMAPEQARGDVEQVDVRSDVYSLGAVLRSLVADGAPHGTRPPPLVSIWEKATAATPEVRYSSAAELAADVTRFLDAQPVSAHREGWLERAGRLYQKYQTAILLVLAYLAMRLLFLVMRGT